MYRTKLASTFAMLLAISAFFTAGPVAAAPVTNPITQVCYGGETSGQERRIDTMLVRLDVTRGTVRGYWVQYGDDIKVGSGARKFDAQPVFIALPPDPEEHPGIFKIDFKEYYSIGTRTPGTTPDPAIPDVLVYRDTEDWAIAAENTVFIEGKIYGNLGNFSSCDFVWRF